jgi:hypothetical protein
VSGATDRMTEMSTVVIEGLAENRGKWVAVDYVNRRVVLSAATRPALVAELKRLGHVGGVVMHVPDVDEPLLVGLG